MSRKARKGLTEMELSILRLLWSANSSLLRNDILENLPTSDFNPVSLYGVLNSMVEKGLISVEGKYNKRYQALMSQEEYAAMQLFSLMPDTSPSRRITGILSFFLNHEEIDPETAKELEEMIHHYREEHEES